MSLFAKLQIGDNQVGNYTKTFSVVRCKYKLERYRDEREGDSADRLSGGLIEIVVQIPKQRDLFLNEWYTENLSLDGQIFIDFSDPAFVDGKRKIQFQNARCYSISESYDIHLPLQRLLKCKISAPSMRVEDILFEKK